MMMMMMMAPLHRSTARHRYLDRPGLGSPVPSAVDMGISRRLPRGSAEALVVRPDRIYTPLRHFLSCFIPCLYLRTHALNILEGCAEYTNQRNYPQQATCRNEWKASQHLVGEVHWGSPCSGGWYQCQCSWLKRMQGRRELADEAASADRPKDRVGLGLQTVRLNCPPAGARALDRRARDSSHFHIPSVVKANVGVKLCGCKLAIPRQNCIIAGPGSFIRCPARYTLSTMTPRPAMAPRRWRGTTETVPWDRDCSAAQKCCPEFRTLCMYAQHLDCLPTVTVTKALLYPFRTRNSLDWLSPTRLLQLDLIPTEKLLAQPSLARLRYRQA